MATWLLEEMRLEHNNTFFLWRLEVRAGLVRERWLEVERGRGLLLEESQECAPALFIVQCCAIFLCYVDGEIFIDFIELFGYILE